MAKKAKQPTVLIDGSREYPDAPDLSKYAGGALVAIGMYLALGSLIDVGVLWIGQRSPNVNWEFAALQSTASEGFFNMTLAVALLFAGLGVRGSRSVAAFRTLSVFMLLLGIGAFAVGGLTVTNYYALVSVVGVDEAALATVQSAVVKSGLLSGGNFLLFMVLGILGLRIKPAK